MDYGGENGGEGAGIRTLKIFLRGTKLAQAGTHRRMKDWAIINQPSRLSWRPIIR